MSFSSTVKKELSVQFAKARHCNISEIAAIVNMCGKIKKIRGRYVIKLQTENVHAAKKYFTLVEKTFNIISEITIQQKLNPRKNKIYMITITQDAQKILLSCGILKVTGGKEIVAANIYSIIVNSVCCKRAYLRGAFLSAGSLSDPEKFYHMEFINPSKAHCEDLSKLFLSFEIESKNIIRKGHYVTYVKDGEQIVSLLNIMEAHNALFNFENTRIMKSMRNDVNRIVNFETANIDKTIAASVKQVEDINYIKNSKGLRVLPRPLFEAARLRLLYPEESLKELGQMMDPPLGKSGINHRLRKISAIADHFREQKEDLYD